MAVFLHLYDGKIKNRARPARSNVRVTCYCRFVGSNSVKGIIIILLM